MNLNYLQYKMQCHCIKMQFQKFVNLLDMSSHDKDLPIFFTKNGLKFMINQEKVTDSVKKLELKHQC